MRSLSSTSLGALTAARIRLVSRNGRDHTRRFRDIAAAVARLSPRTLVLDGEVAIYDEQLRSRFEWLPGRRAGRRPCSWPCGHMTHGPLHDPVFRALTGSR